LCDGIYSAKDCFIGMDQKTITELRRQSDERFRQQQALHAQMMQQQAAERARIQQSSAELQRNLNRLNK